MILTRLVSRRLPLGRLTQRDFKAALMAGPGLRAINSPIVQCLVALRNPKTQRGKQMHRLIAQAVNRRAFEESMR